MTGLAASGRIRATGVSFFSGSKAFTPCFRVVVDHVAAAVPLSCPHFRISRSRPVILAFRGKRDEPVGAFDGVDLSAEDFEPGSTIRICSRDFPTPYRRQSAAMSWSAHYETTIEVSMSWTNVTRALILPPPAGLTGSGKLKKPATGFPDRLAIPTQVVSGEIRDPAPFRRDRGQLISLEIRRSDFTAQAAAAIRNREFHYSGRPRQGIAQKRRHPNVRGRPRNRPPSSVTRAGTVDVGGQLTR